MVTASALEHRERLFRTMSDDQPGHSGSRMVLDGRLTCDLCPTSSQSVLENLWVLIPTMLQQ